MNRGRPSPTLPQRARSGRIYAAGVPVLILAAVLIPSLPLMRPRGRTRPAGTAQSSRHAESRQHPKLQHHPHHKQTKKDKQLHDPFSARVDSRCHPIARCTHCLSSIPDAWSAWKLQPWDPEGTMLEIDQVVRRPRVFFRMHGSLEPASRGCQGQYAAAHKGANKSRESQTT